MREGKTQTPPAVLEQQWPTLVLLAQVLGLQAREPASGAGGISDGEIEAPIEQRQATRKAKNFAEADRIRNELQAKGIKL